MKLNSAKYLLILMIMLFVPFCWGQSDSSYIRPFPGDVTLRPYIYKKFTSLTSEIGGERTTWHPNTPVGVGIGITYRNYALNLAYAPPFFRDKERGKTTYIDFQYHYYSNKYLLDLFFQDYKGFYNVAGRKNEIITLYPDIRVIQYGASAQYVFNHRKFSYKAAFYCNEKQMRSAGSFQLGGGLYYNKLQSDTTQILEGKDRFRNYQVSITGGYVYTFVFKRDYFFTLGLSAGINIGMENIRHSGKQVEVTPNLFPRIAMGYNGDKWALQMNFVLNQVYVTHSNGMNIGFETGRVNLCYIHRLDWSPAFLKKIKIVNR